MTTEKESFASAYQRLKDIYQEISSQEIIDIDKLLLLQEEAKNLHEYLQSRLATLPTVDEPTSSHQTIQ